MAVMSSWLVQAGSFVSTITLRMSTPIENLRGDDVAVAVVARVGAQLGHARLRVADRASRGPSRRRRCRAARRCTMMIGRAAVRSVMRASAAPVRGELRLAHFDARAVLVVPLHPGHQHRQQDEVGEDHDGDADAGGDRHFLHHLHRDQQDGDETDQVGEQRDDGRHQQLPEGLPRGVHATTAGDRGLLDGADLLHAVRHADGEDQERHQQAQRIDAVTEQHQRAELPDHRHDGADDGHHARPSATARSTRRPAA